MVITPPAVSKLNTHILVSKFPFPQKGAGLLLEMLDSKAKREKAEVSPECLTLETKEVYPEWDIHKSSKPSLSSLPAWKNLSLQKE
jgi:hypothetical protein